MREFDSFGALAAQLRKAAAGVKVAERVALHDAGRHVQETAMSYIGHYQQQAGPFPAWAPLAPSTLAGFDDLHGHHPGKEELGFAPPDSPLLRTAELQHGIELTVNERKAVIGVASQTVGTGTPEDPIRDLGDVAVEQEMGTRNMPARSFLGRAGFTQAHHVCSMIGSAVERAVAGMSYALRPPSNSDEPPF